MRYFSVCAPVAEMEMVRLVAQLVLLAETVRLGGVLPAAGLAAVPKSSMAVL